jgi:hypothetical protein
MAQDFAEKLVHLGDRAFDRIRVPNVSLIMLKVVSAFDAAMAVRQELSRRYIKKKYIRRQRSAPLPFEWKRRASLLLNGTSGHARASSMATRFRLCEVGFVGREHSTKSA